jgi:tetratricopeptide (TPR) repeat protein
MSRRPAAAAALVTLFQLAVLAAPPLAGQTDPSYRSALTAWRTGDYEDAIDRLGSLARNADAAPEVHRAYARVLLEVGRADEAERHLREVGGAQVANVLGEALLAVGRWDEAEAEFRAAVDGRASDIEVARVNLAELLWNRGRHAQALRMFDGFIDLYNSGRALDAEELTAVGRAVRRLAVTDPQLFQDALLAFDRAAAAAPQDPLPRIFVGELFLEKYNGTEARASFAEALERNPKHPRALLGVARALDFANEPGAGEQIDKALETNPRSSEAFTLRARLALAAEAFDAARTAVESALDANPGSLEALAILGATEFLDGNSAGYESARDRALAIDRAAADFSLRGGCSA